MRTRKKSVLSLWNISKYVAACWQKMFSRANHAWFKILSAGWRIENIYLVEYASPETMSKSSNYAEIAWRERMKKVLWRKWDPFHERILWHFVSWRVKNFEVLLHFKFFALVFEQCKVKQKVHIFALWQFFSRRVIKVTAELPLKNPTSKASWFEDYYHQVRQGGRF